MKNTKQKETQTAQSESSEEKTPTSEEIVQAIEKCFEEDVKPLWAEWDKDVRIITHGHVPC